MLQLAGQLGPGINLGRSWVCRTSRLLHTRLQQKVQLAQPLQLVHARARKHAPQTDADELFVLGRQLKGNSGRIMATSAKRRFQNFLAAQVSYRGKGAVLGGALFAVVLE